MSVKRTLSYQGRKDAERFIARGDPESVIYELCADIEGYCEIIGKLQDGVWHPREGEPQAVSEPPDDPKWEEA